MVICGKLCLNNQMSTNLILPHLILPHLYPNHIFCGSKTCVCTSECTQKYESICRHDFIEPAKRICLEQPNNTEVINVLTNKFDFNIKLNLIFA